MISTTINYADFFDETKSITELRKKYEEELFVTSGKDLNGWSCKKYRFCTIFFYPATKLMGVYIIIKPVTSENELEKGMKIEMISGFYVNEKEYNPIDKATFNASNHFFFKSFDEINKTPPGIFADGSFKISDLYGLLNTHFLTLNDGDWDRTLIYTVKEKFSSTLFDFDNAVSTEYKKQFESDSGGMKEFRCNYKIKFYGDGKI